MPELEPKVPEQKTVYFCQRCKRVTDNSDRICDFCAEQRKLVPKGGNIKFPEPTDFTEQNF